MPVLDVPELHGHGLRKSTARGACATCSLRSQGEVSEWLRSEPVKKRLDCVFPARRANTEMSAMSTSHPTKQSFCPTTTRQDTVLHAYAFGMIDPLGEARFPLRQIWEFFRMAGVWHCLRNALAVGPERHFASIRFQQLSKMGQKERIPVCGSEGGTGQVRPRTQAASNFVGRHLLILFPPGDESRAIDVLRHAGYSVKIPRNHLCCGRPLTILACSSKAKCYLQKIMQSLGCED